MASPPTPEQVALVQSSWAEVVPLAHVFSTRFYDRLFTIEPKARELFEGRNMVQQSSKFVRMLSLMVRELPHADSIRDELVELGGRHTLKGVRAEHYASMAKALDWSLECLLGSRYTGSTREAWAVAYGYWSGIMCEEISRDAGPGVGPPPAPVITPTPP